MAIENTYLLDKNITLGCGFDLHAKAPLDSRQTVPAFAGLQALIDNNAAYEGMIVYDEETKKTYQAQIVDDVLSFREFGINESELKALIASETTAAMEFKGAATALPENPAKGDMYKVTATFKVGEEDVKVGDSIVYDGEQWFIIPSGDDIEDTWRPVTGVDNDATLTFAAGDKLEKTVAADGTITYKHVAIDAPANMNAEGDEPTRTYITQLITDNHGHVIGFKTATEVVEDTNTTYTFEGQSDEATSVYFQVTSSDAEAADVVYLNAYSKNEADGKFVAKETGKSLISDTEIARLAEIDNYDDEEVRGLIGDNADAIDALEAYVGTIPEVPGEDGNNKYADLDVIGYINKKAQETLAAASGNSSETAASVKGQLDDYIGENNTRVKAVEDALDTKADKSTTYTKTDVDEKVADDIEAFETNVVTPIATTVNKLDGDVNTEGSVKKQIKDAVDASEDTAAATYLTINDAQSTYVQNFEFNQFDRELTEQLTEIEENISKKANADDVYKKTETFTQSEITDAIALAISLEENRALGAEATLEANLGAVDGRVTVAEGKIATLEGESAKHALKSDVEAEFAKYTKTEDLPTDLGDFTNNAGYAKAADVYDKNTADGKFALKEHEHTKADITDFAHTHTASEITDFATEVAKVKVADAAHADAASKVDNALTVKVGGADVVFDGSAAKTADVDAAIKAAVDAIPEQTDYTVSIEEDTTDSTIAKRYIFKQLGSEIGRIDLAKELVVTSGSVKEVTVADAPYSGAKVGDKYIELVIANQETPIYVPAKDLVDIYTAKDGATEVQVAISNTNEISATLVNGGITEEKLAEGVKTKLNKTWEEVGVAAGLVEALENGQVKANKEAIEKLNGADTVDGSVAKSIKDAITAENLGQYAKTADLGDLAALDTITADKVTDFAAEVAKVKVDEATKATQDGNGKVIADTYAAKAVTYTKEEVDALIQQAHQWGEF